MLLTNEIKGFWLFILVMAVIVLFYLLLLNFLKPSRDELTGLFNRRSLVKKLNQSIKDGKRFYIIVISLDDFKFFNESYGHYIGDAMLKQVGQYLKHCLNVNKVYRYSGDEFAVVVDSNLVQVTIIVDKILTRFKDVWMFRSSNYLLSSSVGIGTYTPDINTVEQILSAAEFSICEAKSRGKRQAVYYDEKHVYKIKRKHEITDALKRAIEQNSFEVYYQPIYDVFNDRFSHAESLVRLNDPLIGSISPGEFIPIAEETGMIIDITYIVLNKVCQFLKEFKEIQSTFTTIGINISAVNFLYDNFPSNVIEILDKYQVNPNIINFEITESIIIESFETVKCVMEKLSAHGITFSLDDYGQGYSNLLNIIKLPFNNVKIDKNIVWAIKEHNTLIASIISTIKKVGIRVVAEGVETQEQSDLLKYSLCDYIQGYLYAVPMCQTEFIKCVN